MMDGKWVTRGAWGGVLAALLLAGVLGGLSLSLMAGGREASSIDRSLEALGFVKFDSDTEAEEFTLTELSGKTTRLADLRGKVVLLSFWTTW